MASVLTAPSPDRSTQPSTEQITKTHETATKSAHDVAARDLVRLGRAATVKEGLNWITLVTVITLGLAIVGCFMVYDSLLLQDMIDWQRTPRIAGFSLWG